MFGILQIMVKSSFGNSCIIFDYSASLRPCESDPIIRLITDYSKNSKYRQNDKRGSKGRDPK